MRILNIRVDEKNMEQSLAAIADFIAAFHHGTDKCSQVVTINPEGIILAQDDALLQEAIERAALVTADGSGILWAASQKGEPLGERVTGIDLTYRLAEKAAEQGWSLYLLGAKPGIAASAAANLRSQYPALKIKGIENGYFSGREAQVLADIQEQSPDILLAALGMPYQEKWLHQHRQQLNCGVMIGIGGSFDVIAGQVRRAPNLLRQLRLEWLWRLACQPSRWRRYLAIPPLYAGSEKRA